jgi:hypothetical protein
LFLADFNASIETASTAGMAGSGIAPDVRYQQDAILIAIYAYFSNCEDVTTRFALSPKPVARPAPEMRFTGFNRPLQGFLVHIGEHQDIAVPRISDDGRDQAVPIEAGRKLAPALQFLFCECH